MRGVAEAARFVRLGVERLHHHVAAQRLLENLVQLALLILRAPAGAADAPADLARRQDDERQHDEAEQRQPPVLAEHDHEPGTIAVKNCRSKSARMCEMATWTLSMSFMMDDISRPVECASKNSAPCFCTLSKTVLRRSVTAENPT